MAVGRKRSGQEGGERATAGLEPTPDNLELFYRQARILEQAGDPDSLHRALEIYDTIVTLRIDFRDARQRRTELKNVLRGSADKPPG